MKLRAHLSNLLKLAAIIMVLVVLVSCAAPAKPAATQPVTTGPKYGGTLHLAYVMDLSTMDPIMSTSIVDRALPILYTDTLVKWQGKNDEKLTVVPALASSWDIAPDGLTYTFHLRKGVKWQNLPPVNGRDFTAADAKFSLERVMDPKSKSPLAPYVASFKDIQAPDDYTLVINMKAADPTVLATLCGGTAGMCAKEVIAKDGDAGKTIVGTGPFILEKYTPGVGFAFKKNPDYWDKGKPYLDRLELTFVPDASARVAAFRAGQLDRVVEGKLNTDAIKSTVKNVQLIPGCNLIGSAFIPSLKYPDKPWAKKEVRQALQYAIDYDGLISAVLNGQGSRTDYLAPSFADYGARQVAELPKRDIAKAKAMLTAAGYPDGFKAVIMQHTNRLDAWGGAVEPLAPMLKEIGVDLTIQPMQQADFVSKTRAGDFEFCTMALICNSPELDNNLSPMYKTKGTYNRAVYSNPRVDELLDLQRKAFNNVPDRQKYSKQILDILHEDVPIIPLYYQYDTHIAQPWVKGWDNAGDPATFYAWQELPGVWLDK
jgi:ABC-type transport system substrate-binding protein